MTDRPPLAELLATRNAQSSGLTTWHLDSAPVTGIAPSVPVTRPAVAGMSKGGKIACVLAGVAAFGLGLAYLTRSSASTKAPHEPVGQWTSRIDAEQRASMRYRG